MLIPDFARLSSIKAFNYDLPDAQIAKYPLDNRDESKLLVWKNNSIRDDQFLNLASHLESGSILVFNNARVIRARLHFKKDTGGTIEIFVLDPIEPADYALNFQQTENCTWKCIVGNLKKWKSGSLLMTILIDKAEVKLYAENLERNGNSCIIKFSWDNSNYNFAQLLEAAGNIPIPPYLHRESEESDLTRYQTVYSKVKGSVAAPTAGLHFTDRIFNSLNEANIETAELTLHVGAGTFQPVKAESIGDHEMHNEHFSVDLKLLERLIQHGKRPLIAVGTTTIRTLESLYLMGCKVAENPKISTTELPILQWDAYNMNIQLSRLEAFEALRKFMLQNNLSQINSSTQIIIVPGFTFNVIDGMITNFHQPQSTLLLLISAFLGNNWKSIYEHAIANNYRFLSYGDACLFLGDKAI